MPMRSMAGLSRSRIAVDSEARFGIAIVTVDLYRDRRRRFRRAHIDDARSLESIQHLTHQRMSGGEACALGLKGVRLLLQSRRSRPRYKGDHPELARPILQALRQCRR